MSQRVINEYSTMVDSGDAVRGGIVFWQRYGFVGSSGNQWHRYIFRNQGESMISKILFPVAFATGCVGLVFASVPFVVAAMAITAMAGFIRTGE
jgi:hypothetical protein